MSTAAAPTVVDLSSGGGWDEIAAATHIGPVRSENQDAFAVTALRGEGFGLVLADGMGGQAGGGEAAAAATSAAVDSLAAAGATEAAVLAAVGAANHAVATVRAQLGGQPGTTLTIALVTPQAVVIGHAGDTRAYLIRGSEATVLTSDHSWVGEQVRAGALESGAERRHPRRNVITMAVMGDDIVPEVVAHSLLAGDVLMLCSDGFWEPLADRQIAGLLGVPGPMPNLIGAAAAAALAAGATDNVTLLAARLPN